MSTGKFFQLNPQKGLAKSAGIISLATLLSRLLGFVRDIIIARMFGIYIYAQAFVIAFRLPNLFRDLIGEGAGNAAIVPVLCEYKIKKSKEEFWQLANILLNLLLVILGVITIFGVIFAPLLVRLIAPGFIASPDKLALTIKLTRIIFPYILLIGLAAYAMAMLNSLKNFTVSAFAPCLLNISIIVFALWFGEGIKGLGFGVLVGGALQLLVQLPVLYKQGFRFKPLLRINHPGVKQIGKLMMPRVFSSGIYQLNNFMDSIFASFAWIVGDGAIAVLYFAYRLIQFPLGIFSNAISQVVLPTFSAQALEPGLKELKTTLSWALRMVFFVLLPATVIYMVLARSLIFTFFGGGKFDFHSGVLTAQALFFYSIGLCAYGGTKILQSCFFALKDTLTTTKVAFVALIINLLLNAALMFPLKIAGLALATSISGISGFCILFSILYKRLGGVESKLIGISCLRILAASLAMGAIAFLVNNALNVFWALASAVLAYIFFCFIFKVEEMRQLFNWLMRPECLK
jgi:putative peptidoglycan lipid II flippase